MKKPITILARLGQSCNYNKIQEIQTAQAELAQEMSSLQHPLPLIPVDSTSKVKIFFWWDNFDCNKETIEGSVHTCHGVAFQEESAESMERNQVFEVPESKTRTISVVPIDLPKRKVTPRKSQRLFTEPPHTSTMTLMLGEYCCVGTFYGKLTALLVNQCQDS